MSDIGAMSVIDLAKLGKRVDEVRSACPTYLRVKLYLHRVLNKPS